VVASATIPSATNTSVPIPVSGPTATTTNTPPPVAPSASPTPQPTLQSPPQPQQPVQPQPTKAKSPSNPSNFKPTGTGTTIKFSWSDNSTNETGFRIYQNGVTAPVVTAPANTGTGGVSIDWTGRPCGFSATFSVRAFNDNGESGSSNSDTGLTIPCVPTSLSAQMEGDGILFNWAVASQHDEAGFHIYEQGNPNPVTSRGPNLGSGGTNLPWTGLSCNILGTFTVRAYNSAGESSDSNAIQTETVPCSPSNLSAYNISKFDFGFSFMDNATNETGFHVYEDDKLYVPMNANPGTGIVKTGFSQQCNETHVWSIKAYNNAGESRSSEHLGVTTPSNCL
jgi:Cu/Zn superoxide dismutase